MKWLCMCVHVVCFVNQAQPTSERAFHIITTGCVIFMVRLAASDVKATSHKNAFLVDGCEVFVM